MLSCLCVSLASMLDTHPPCFSIFVFYIRLLQSDVGAQELEYPGGAYYDVEIADYQE